MRPSPRRAVIARRMIRCLKAATHASHIRPIFGKYYGDPFMAKARIRAQAMAITAGQEPARLR